MFITDVTVRKANTTKSNFLGSASVTFDGVLTIHDVKIMNGKNGVFVSLPDRKGTDDKYYSIVWIADNSLLDSLKAKVLEEFNKEGK